ncbi:MAG: patatin-like phospholipase family protein [Oscillospiraceae bacterium]|jgi:NTE family protein|nr:patatin-like phospholipase family protein [Oscillospiraceae bacterium]
MVKLNRDALRIGIALSGGGIRATIFHLGVFKYLAERRLLGRLANISSVSGASICVGLIFAFSGNIWPGDAEYLLYTLPDIESLILTNDIQFSALCRLPFSPRYWRNKAGLLSQVLRKKFGITGVIQDLPDYPYWEINSTTFETGKSFRVRKDYMGDYTLGYVQRPELPVSDMIAASAGFPVLIGPLKLKSSRYKWSADKYGALPEAVPPDVHLWDGGVYDNLGLEALHKIGKGLDDEINYLIVSNASGESGRKTRSVLPSAGNLMRLLNIAMDQVGSLRTRELQAAVISKGLGLYLEIGSSAEQIANAAKLESSSARRLIDKCLSPADAKFAADYKTTLESPGRDNYELLLRHGYEVARCNFEFNA